MRNERIITLLVWCTWSALCAGGLVYLGANTEPYQAQWPLAGLTGAIVGAAAALVALLLWGDRRGILLMGLPFGLLQAIISGPVLWGSK